MSCAPVPKKTRKPGSGRKRKVDALTSADYARMLEQHQWVEGMSPVEEKAFKKKKRALKNRMSALKSREKKRARMDDLQQQVLLLQQQVASLKQENLSLRQNRDTNSAPRKNVLKVCQVPARPDTISQPYITVCNTSSSTANSASSTAVPANGIGHTVSVYASPECSNLSNSSPPCAPDREPAQRDAMEEFAFDIFDAMDYCTDASIDAIIDGKESFEGQDICAETGFFADVAGILSA